MAVKSWSYGRSLAQLDSEELAARLTCLTLLLSPIGDWYIRPLVLCLAAAGLLVEGWWRHAGLWWALAVLTLARALVDWPMADNHAYLLGYWCLALALSRGLGDGAGLARNARYLIGLSFALAACQKWSSADYRNDVFFLSTFLLDNRFEDLVVLLTSITYEQIDVARDYLEGDYRWQPAGEFPFPLPSDFLWMARFSTLWNLVEQTLVAVAFLLPRSSWLGRHRDATLLVFCFSIYAVAPVVGFGWLLLAMGTAQAERSLRLRVLYLIAFATLAFYEQVPWAGLLVAWFEA